jgi:DNA-binding IclR family transcriptional regulator
MGWVLRQDHDPDGARSSFEKALRLSRRSGDRADVAYASLGLACLAADEGDWHRAAMLHGVAQAFLDRTGLPWEKLEARYRQDQLERAHAKSMALSFGEAFDFASGQLPQPDPLV